MNSHQLRKLSGIALISFAITVGSLAAANASPLDDACAAYGKHNYSIALTKLDALAPAQRNAKSSYYRALTLQALHRYEEANDEYRKVAVQRNDINLAGLARQGMIGLSRMPKQRSFQRAASTPELASTAATTKPVKNIVVEGGNWKVAEPGFGAQGVNKNGMPDGWTYAKTSNGCGRH